VSASKILVVDDELDMVESCARILKRVGHQCLTATDPATALALVESERPDLVLTDLKMPGSDGMELLRRARELDPALPVILVTAFASIESAVEAIKQGAFDYLPKNFSVEQLCVAVERGLRHRRLQEENLSLREQLQGTLGFENILGRSPATAGTRERPTGRHGRGTSDGALEVDPSAELVAEAGVARLEPAGAAGAHASHGWVPDREGHFN